MSRSRTRSSESLPGQPALERGFRAAILPLLCLTLLLGVVLGMLLPFRWGHPFIGLLLFLLFLIQSPILWRRSEARMRRAIRGAAGEQRVAALLDSLGPEWHSFHALSLGEGDLDHLLLGPPGVIALETLNWAGRISWGEEGLQDDQRQYDSFTRASLSKRLEGLRTQLPDEDVPLSLLLCSVGGRLVSGAEAPEGMQLCEDHELLQRLRDLPDAALSPDQRTRLRNWNPLGDSR